MLPNIPQSAPLFTIMLFYAMDFIQLARQEEELRALTDNTEYARRTHRYLPRVWRIR